jgi:hypothetical protein
MLRIVRVLLGLPLGVLVAELLACASEVGSCIAGTPGCNCTAEGTCEAGLYCVRNRCVEPEEVDTETDPGTEDAAGATSSGEPPP